MSFVSLLAAVSCNEKLNISEYHSSEPSISGFSPVEGPAGTQITVEGHGLGKITSAKINGEEIEIKYCISNSVIILKATDNASSGRLTLEGPDGVAESEDVFTYTYPVPVIEKTPEKDEFFAANPAVITGENLNAVSRVTFGDTEAEIISSSKKELVFMVPDLRETVDLDFFYFDGSEYVSAMTISDVQVVRQVPAVTELSKETDDVTGDEITVTGKYLNFVETITLAGIRMPVTSVSSDGTSLKFKVNDDKSFPDGDNSGALVFTSFEGTEILTVRDDFAFFVPTFYTWKNANLNAHSTEKLNHLFCLETGMTYAIDQFATDVDPLSVEMNGAVCTAKNTLDPSVTEEDYYAVKPYIYFMYLGSGCYFYGPANSNNRLSNFKSSAGESVATGYGTPIIKFRTLCADIPEEKAIIDKIRGGSFTSDDFTPDLLSGIDLVQTGESTVDSWSNVPNGEFGAYKDDSKKGSTNHRPWAPFLTSATETVDGDPGTVVLILYFKPEWDGDPDASAENIYKFGFMNITRLVQNADVERGRQNNATFDIYWQRTPMSE